ADRVWRIVFLIAMVLGGLFAVYVLGGHVPDQYSGSLILVIVAVTGKKGSSSLAGLVIGFTLVLIHLLGIPLTGTSV
ncbi:aquaporin, partial [Escherichia coli]|nr:aquaporin [Escherichia coli]